MILYRSSQKFVAVNSAVKLNSVFVRAVQVLIVDCVPRYAALAAGNML